jgi:hypothetical protein
MARAPLGWRGWGRQPSLLDLNPGEEPPQGDYVRYVEHLLARSDELRRQAQAKAPASASATAPPPLGPRPVALPGARGRAAKPGSVLSGTSTLHGGKVAEQEPAQRGGLGWLWRAMPKTGRVWMALAWLGLVALFFLAPALLPLAMGLIVAVGLVQGIWKKHRP